MQSTYKAFEDRDTVVIAIAQEDKDLASFGKMLQKFDGNPSFELVADLDRRGTPRYDRTAVYLIDRDGVVRQIFPATIRNRPDWATVLNEIDGMKKGAASRPATRPSR